MPDQAPNTKRQGLLSRGRGQRGGAQPSGGVLGEPSANPNTQKFQKLTATVLKWIFVEGLDSVMKKLTSGRPLFQEVAQITFSAIYKVWVEAQRAGDKITPAMAKAAATRVIDELFRLAAEAGVEEATGEEAQEQKKMALLEATKMYGERVLQSGKVDSGKARQQLRSVMEQDAERTARGGR